MPGKPTPRTILIVEDNPGMRALIHQLVGVGGAIVHECEDGQLAVESYERIRPDIVVMDITMPRLDGITATRAIRQSDPKAQVVIVTEHDEPSYRRAATDAGARGFLSKENLLELPTLLTKWDGSGQAEASA